MKNYKNAVIAFLNLYKFALIQKELSSDTSNYDHILYKVTDYFRHIELYEAEILKMRYIDSYSLEKIATTLGYKSHSSIVPLSIKSLINLPYTKNN